MVFLVPLVILESPEQLDHKYGTSYLQLTINFATKVFVINIRRTCTYSVLMNFSRCTKCMLKLRICTSIVGPRGPLRQERPAWVTWITRTHWTTGGDLHTCTCMILVADFPLLALCTLVTKTWIYELIYMTVHTLHYILF